MEWAGSVVYVSMPERARLSVIVRLAGAVNGGFQTVWGSARGGVPVDGK